jgi:multiple sugar transport system substrate-binding protein
MYDGLYDCFAEEVRSGAIEVVVHADHPTLNRAVAERLAAGDRLDVISTHGKYAPSQAAWLQPLDDLLPAELLEPLAPRARDLCSFRGALLCAPRNIDVRVLWWRTDRLSAAPVSWDDVEATGGFGFTGRESGLFGLFFELVAGAGGALFDDQLRPTLDGPAARAAVERLQRLAAKAPDDLPGWHYDDVDDALLGGRIDQAAAWPGGYDRIRASDLYDRLAPAPYPGGRSYSGCHGWAIPATCGDVPGAVDLVARLCSLDAGLLEARAGGVPAHLGALERHEPVDDTDRRRWEVTRATIDAAMLTYPPLVDFPAVEDAGWGALHDALRGACSAAEAVDRMQAAAAAILA